MATGKISRLPREIREQVNEKLDAGEPGKRLVAWLNELPAVRALLAEEFDGAAINEQNLTNWKQGGFREWRMEREVRAFAKSTAGTEVPVVTPEQLSTVLAVRYLVAVREWQQSPVSSERRWRLMRVILRDVLKLQREGHREQRLELEQEKLQFAMERFEDKQQTDVRRVMTAFLMAAKQWPEVQEALAGAFRLLQERKGAKTEKKEAELESIKVNQGEKKSEKEETQTKLVGCSPSPQSSPSAFAALRRDRPGRGDDLAQFRIQESVTTSATVGGARTEGNKTKLGPIKVDQGEKNKKAEAQGIGLGGCRGYQRIRPLTPALSPLGGERGHILRRRLSGGLRLLRPAFKDEDNSADGAVGSQTGRSDEDISHRIEISPAGLFPLHSQ